jgi:hypothetical protein
MEDDTLVMGSTFPVEVAVYLPDPRAFFDTIRNKNHNNHKTKPLHFFSSSTQGGNTRTLDNYKKKNSSVLLPVPEAAFQLLQWAHYGHVPIFPTNQPQIDSDENPKSADKLLLSNDETNEVDSLEEEEEDTEELLEEDAFENEDTNEEEKSVVSNAMNDCMEQSAQHWTAILPEADEPQGFLEKNVRLRSYQKQALHFMMERETSGHSREQMEEQLALLRELSTLHQEQQQESGFFTTTTHSILATMTKNAPDIVCDCGPVIVSEEAQKKSQPLDGEINPVNHPLWQRRFLAKPDLSSSVCFYVNELLGTATYRPPEPPRPCSGGILADGMY